MALVDFSSQLGAAGSVPDLARLLGKACMERADELSLMRRDAQTKTELERIELGVAEVPLATWEEVIRAPSLLEERIGPDLVALIWSARARQPLDFFGVLRGLCRKPLATVYATTVDQIELSQGTPVRFATRPLKFKPTTKQMKLNRNSLLYPYPYSLFPYSSREQLRVILDFAHRDRLDDLTWDKEDGLSRIATIHPARGGEIEYSPPENGRIFDVRPKHWDPDAILNLLSEVREEVAIAVLPELSLPTPGALEQALAEEPGAYPPIVVAGSAHCREGVGDDGSEIRANESRVYLDGRCVAIAHKHHSYEGDDEGEERESPQEPEEERLEEPEEETLTEDLTEEPKTILVLSGARTRVAVIICADALDLQIPRLLVSAGVNLLLIPAMTRQSGSFSTVLGDIAGYCQGVGAVANARFVEDGEPFLCFAAAPRPEPAKQLAPLTGKGIKPLPQIGIFDPNRPLPGAVSWR
ncbi:MAG TPA: hypothetical protein VF081_02630 [Solirubrobacterales bacterium]